MSKNNTDEPDEAYPFPLVLKKKAGTSVSGLTSGQTTPGTAGKSAGKQKLLSEGDLQRADEALSSLSSSFPPRFLPSSLYLPSRSISSLWSITLTASCTQQLRDSKTVSKLFRQNSLLPSKLVSFLFRNLVLVYSLIEDINKIIARAIRYSEI